MDKFSEWLVHGEFYSRIISEGQRFGKLPLSSAEEATEMLNKKDISVKGRKRIREFLKSKEEIDTTVAILKQNKRGNWDIEDIY
jgi:hypothetical protein